MEPTNNESNSPLHQEIYENMRRLFTEYMPHLEEKHIVNTWHRHLQEVILFLLQLAGIIFLLMFIAACIVLPFWFIMHAR
jgi:hypothetical protein